MPVIRNGVVMQLTVSGQDDKSSQAVNNVLHVRAYDPAAAYGADLVGSDMNVAILGFRSLWRELLGNVSDHYTVINYRLVELIGKIPEIPDEQEGTWTYGTQAEEAGVPVDDVGGAVGEALPLFAAYSIRKKTAFAGKRFRGGMRLSPVVEEDQSNGRIDEIRFANLQLALTPFLAGWNPGTVLAVPKVKMVVASLVEALLEPVDVFTQSTKWAKDVTGLLISPNTGSQTSRKPRLSDPINEDA